MEGVQLPLREAMVCRDSVIAKTCRRGVAASSQSSKEGGAFVGWQRWRSLMETLTHQIPRG